MSDIKFEDFTKLNIVVGTIVEAERVEDSERLLKLMIDVGESRPRQIISGIADSYDPEPLVNKQVPVLINLEYKEIFGLESQGMILAVDESAKPVLLHPDKSVKPGSKVC